MQLKSWRVLCAGAAALGGAEAIRKGSSRVEKGSISFAGHESPIEVFAKAPNKAPVGDAHGEGRQHHGV